LLIQIDRRNIKEGKSKRNRKTKVKDKTDGSHMCGPFLFIKCFTLLQQFVRHKAGNNLKAVKVNTNEV